MTFNFMDFMTLDCCSVVRASMVGEGNGLWKFCHSLPTDVILIQEIFFRLSWTEDFSDIQLAVFCFDIRVFIRIYANGIWIFFCSVVCPWRIFYITIVHIFRSLTRKSFFAYREKN